MAAPLDARIEALTRDQLATLVRRLVRHDPDLEDLVHLPLPGEASRVDGGRIRDQVGRNVQGIGWDWRASSRAERELWPIVMTGRKLADWVEPASRAPLRRPRTAEDLLGEVDSVQFWVGRRFRSDSWDLARGRLSGVA